MTKLGSSTFAKASQDSNSHSSHFSGLDQELDPGILSPPGSSSHHCENDIYVQCHPPLCLKASSYPPCPPNQGRRNSKIFMLNPKSLSPQGRAPHRLRNVCSMCLSDHRAAQPQPLPRTGKLRNEEPSQSVKAADQHVTGEQENRLHPLRGLIDILASQNPWQPR